VIYADGRSATLEVERLVGDGVFPFPKNREVIADFISLLCEDGDIILDYFAGSGTTAHAAFGLAAAKDKSVKFIMVQLPEKIEEESRAYEAGYRTIADVGKARLRKAVDEYKESSDALDFGFRVFTLDRSHFKQWRVEATNIIDPDLVAQMEQHADHIDRNATQEGILYELLIKAGFVPTEKIEILDLAGKQVFSISEGALLICLEEELTSELIDAVADREPMQFICLDKGFKGNDQLKANAVQTFKSRSQGAETEMVFKVV
jgi:adenine-specific DNA-methyltransferase